MLKNYKELQVWQRGYKLCFEIYQMTGNFPQEEKYGLTSQIRRAAISVPSNIAEGYGRKTTKEYLQALHIAYGSLCELETQIMLAGDLKYLRTEKSDVFQKEIGDIERMLKALIKSLENKHLTPRILESLDPIKGVTLVELLIALTIFSVVMAVVYSLYANQVKHSTREYKLAEHEMEFGIAKNILERDIMLAGYGIADNYGFLPYDPLPIAASDVSFQTTFDSISLRGTAVGIFSRTSQGWSYIKDNGPPVTFQTWSDSRENIAAGDRVIYMHPATRELLTDGTTAIFTFPASPSGAEKGTLLYGIHSDSAVLPYITAEYVIGGTPPPVCASGSKNLLRAESRNSDPPLPGNREPILNCVLDFQVAFGLDSGFEEDGLIDDASILQFEKFEDAVACANSLYQEKA